MITSSKGVGILIKQALSFGVSKSSLVLAAAVPMMEVWDF